MRKNNNKHSQNIVDYNKIKIKKSVHFRMNAH